MTARIRRSSNEHCALQMGALVESCLRHGCGARVDLVGDVELFSE